MAAGRTTTCTNQNVDGAGFLARGAVLGSQDLLQQVPAVHTKHIKYAMAEIPWVNPPPSLLPLKHREISLGKLSKKGRTRGKWRKWRKCKQKETVGESIKSTRKLSEINICI
jgi:hypothetical protein